MAKTNNPFSTTADPVNFYQTEHIQKYLRFIFSILDQRQGLVNITGEINFGKTATLQYLLNEYGTRENCKIKLINAQKSTSQLSFLKNIFDDFEIKPIRPMSDYRRAIEQFLFAEGEKQNTIILLIDDAQNLSDSQFELIHWLLNIETYIAKLIQIVIAGTDELTAKLKSKRNRAVFSRVVLRYLLKPFTLTETKAMIQAKCDHAKIENPFSEDDLERIYTETSGVPGFVLSKCTEMYDR